MRLRKRDGGHPVRRLQDGVTVVAKVLSDDRADAGIVVAQDHRSISAPGLHDSLIVDLIQQAAHTRQGYD